MKFLLLLLLSFSAIAQQRILFKPNDTSIATQFVDGETVEVVKESAVKIIGKSKSIKGVWVKDSSSILQRERTDLEGNAFNEGFDSTSHTFELIDVTEEINAKNALKALNKAIDCGSLIVKLITIRNSQKGLTSAQFLEIIETYSGPKSLMESGALQSAKDLIQTLTPDGVKITEDDKTFAISKLDECLQ